MNWIAQATQPVTEGQLGDVKMALVALAVLVIGTLGVVLVQLIRKGGALAEVLLEVRAAAVKAQLAEIKADVAVSSASEARRTGAVNTQNITALANQVTPTTPPTGTGGISGTGPGGSIP